VIVPSVFARERLRELGAPLPWERVHVIAPPVRLPLADHSASPKSESAQGEAQGYALVVSRLAPEKGVDVAIDACRMADIPLVIAGEGPELQALRERGGDRDVRFVGQVGDEELAELRAGAAIALVPSRSAETFGLAAAEAMAAGLPVAASRVGALPELVDERGLVSAGDASALAQAIGRLAGDRVLGEEGLERVRAVCSPERVAASLSRIYDAAT
jgi:glycosyltransferase involved in cell wall biosynthesis